MSSSLEQVDQAHKIMKAALMSFEHIFVCSACKSALDRPMRIGVCGHAVCSDCAAISEGVCPICTVPIMNRDVVVDRGLRNIVAAIKLIKVRLGRVVEYDSEEGDEGEDRRDEEKEETKEKLKGVEKEDLCGDETEGNFHKTPVKGIEKNSIETLEVSESELSGTSSTSTVRLNRFTRAEKSVETVQDASRLENSFDGLAKRPRLPQQKALSTEEEASLIKCQQCLRDLSSDVDTNGSMSLRKASLTRHENIASDSNSKPPPEEILGFGQKVYLKEPVTAQNSARDREVSSEPHPLPEDQACVQQRSQFPETPCWDSLSEKDNSEKFGDLPKVGTHEKSVTLTPGENILCDKRGNQRSTEKFTPPSGNGLRKVKTGKCSVSVEHHRSNGKKIPSSSTKGTSMVPLSCESGVPVPVPVPVEQTEEGVGRNGECERRYTTPQDKKLQEENACKSLSNKRGDQDNMTLPQVDYPGAGQRDLRAEEHNGPASMSDVVSLRSATPDFVSTKRKPAHKCQVLQELMEAEEALCFADRELHHLCEDEGLESDCDSYLPMVVICCSGVRKGVVEKCEVLVRLFGGRLVSEVDTGTPPTHLVTDVNALNEIRNHSLKIYYAMLKRIPILSSKWVDACLEQGTWVEESKYEVNSQHNRSRGVFDSVVASTRGEFASPPNMDVADVRMLLEVGGAVLADSNELSRIAEREQKFAFIVIDAELERNSIEELPSGVKLVGVPWLMDCITTGSCPPTNEVMFETLNASSESYV